MTHEQRAKKSLEKLYFAAFGVLGPKQRKEIDELFHHMKEAIKAEMPRNSPFDGSIV